MLSTGGGPEPALSEAEGFRPGFWGDWWPILIAFFATRVGPWTCAMPSRNNSVIPTGAKRSGGTLRFHTAAQKRGGRARPKPPPHSSGCPAQASLGRGCSVVTDSFLIGN